MDCSCGTLAGSGIIGLIVGVMTGIFGVGGGFLLTPALMILLGVSGPVAVGTGLATILVNSTIGMFKRRGSKTIDIKLALIIAAGSIIGVLFGSQLLEAMKDAPKIVVFGKEQETVQYGLLWMFLFLLVWIAGYLYFDHIRNGGKSQAKRVGLFAKFRIAPCMEFSSLDEPKLSVLVLLLTGLLVGFLTGLLGIGGGVVLLPILVYLVGQHTNKAAGTSLLLVWISSLAAVIRKGGQGDVVPLLFVVLTIGGIIGTFVGTKIGLKLAGSKIRLYFVYIVIAAALLVGFKLYTMTF